MRARVPGSTGTSLSFKRWAYEHFGRKTGHLVKQRRKLLLEVLPWDAPGKNSCTHMLLLPSNLKKTSEQNHKTALHEHTDLIMDCYVCTFSNKSFFLLALYEIHIYTHRVEYSSSSPNDESLSLWYLWQTNKSNQKSELGPRLHCSLPLLPYVLLPQHTEGSYRI